MKTTRMTGSLKNKLRMFTALIILIITVSGTAALAQNVNVTMTVEYGQSEARTILKMINSFRKSADAWYWNENNASRTVCQNLSSLQYDSGLEKVAMQRAAEIALAYGHTRPNDTSCFTAYAENSVTYVWAGENIAAGYDTAAEVHQAWREDDEYYDGQGHRRVMLSDKYNAVGIGHVYYNGYHYWTEEFGQISSPKDKGKVKNGKANATVSLADYKVKGLQVGYASNLQGLKLEAQVQVTTVKLTVDGQWPEVLDRPVNMEPTFTASNSSGIYYSSGKITARAEGSGTIRASLLGVSCSTSYNVHDCRDHGEIGNNCTVCGSIVTKEVKLPVITKQTVKHDEESGIPSKKDATIKLSCTKLKISKGKTKVIKVSSLKGSDAVKGWKSSNKKVATVDKNGKIKAKSAGKAVITVTLKSGKTATVKVIVK